MEIRKEQAVAFLKAQFKNGDVVIKLLFINLGVYLGLKFVDIIEWILRLPSDPISAFLENWFYLSNHWSTALLKFYTLFSYQFIHDDFLHLFVNLLLLFFFGKMLLPMLGVKKLVPLYLLGGVFGGLVFLLFNFLGVLPMIDKSMIGASASIMALMGAAAFAMPNYNIKFFLFFDVKLKWLVAGFAFLNLLGLRVPDGAGTSLIHVGGLLFGLTYMYIGSKGVRIDKPFNAMIDYLMAVFKKKPKPKVTFVNPNYTKKQTKKAPIVNQDNIDAILDKISTNGYESLTKEEKDYLFKASKN